MTKDCNRAPPTCPGYNGNGNDGQRDSFYGPPNVNDSIPQDLRQLIGATSGVSFPSLLSGMMASSTQQLSSDQRREILASIIQEALDIVDDDDMLIEDFEDFGKRQEQTF
jgi:hypothetical protein